MANIYLKTTDNNGGGGGGGGGEMKTLRKVCSQLSPSATGSDPHVIVSRLGLAVRR